MWWTIFVGGWLIFLAWAVLLLPSIVWLRLRSLERKTAHLPDLKHWPAVSVIVPARDEGAQIEAGLASLLASDYPNLEIIAVDDRSTDETGSLMDRAAETDSRLKVIHISELPDGWLGKTHAMHVASQAAVGDYLLFSDGDVMFEPQTIHRAVRYVEHGKIDHLSLLPRITPGGYFENALVSFFGVMFTAGTQLWMVPTRLTWVYVGIGAFNLVRREAYRQAGGHETIRLDVLDDVKLGKMMKRSGFSQDILIGRDAISVRWQNSAWGVVRGLEKNGFAALDYSIGKLLFVSAVFMLMTVVPYVALIAVPDLRCLPFAATIVLIHVLYALCSKMFGSGWNVWPMLLPAGLAMLFSVWRSAIITLRQGGVRWRDTFYPLSLLREHLYR